MEAIETIRLLDVPPTGETVGQMEAFFFSAYPEAARAGRTAEILSSLLEFVREKKVDFPPYFDRRAAAEAGRRFLLSGKTNEALLAFYRAFSLPRTEKNDESFAAPVAGLIYETMRYQKTGFPAPEEILSRYASLWNFPAPTPQIPIAYNESEYRFYRNKYLARAFFGGTVVLCCVVSVFWLRKPSVPIETASAWNENALRAVVEFPQTTIVKGGVYLMGAENEIGDADERPTRPVRVNDFELGKYEVTRAQYAVFAREKLVSLPNESVMNEEVGAPETPVTDVSWYRAIEYCNWLSERHELTPCYRFLDDYTVEWNPTADGYRLPTEAEWEFAARGGLWSRETPFSGGKDLNQIAIYRKTAKDGRPAPVGQKKANELGAYDMTGNVWEWCWDAYADDYTQSAALNAVRVRIESQAVAMRGGSFLDVPHYLRIANRANRPPRQGQSNLGFRVVRNTKSR